MGLPALGPGANIQLKGPGIAGLFIKVHIVVGEVVGQDDAVLLLQLTSLGQVFQNPLCVRCPPMASPAPTIRATLVLLGVGMIQSLSVVRSVSANPVSSVLKLKISSIVKPVKLYWSKCHCSH